MTFQGSGGGCFGARIHGSGCGGGGGTGDRRGRAMRLGKNKQVVPRVGGCGGGGETAGSSEMGKYVSRACRVKEHFRCVRRRTCAGASEALV